VEILYFDGCPTYKATEKTLREVIVEEGMDAEIKLVKHPNLAFSGQIGDPKLH
jgi:hypothetical protein